MKKSRRAFVKLAGLGALGTAFIGHTVPAKDFACLKVPRQELGPFAPMKYREQVDHDIDLTQLSGQEGKAMGNVIVVKGIITDALCQPLAGAIVEIWQANHHGKYRHEYDDDGKSDPNFQGWGQAITNAQGEYSFTTVIPGLYARRARHIHYKVSKRGFHEMITQLYFEGEKRNKTDGLLNSFTHEQQLRVIGIMNNATPIPSIVFNIALEEIIEGMLPPGVLDEYVGTYDVQFTGTEYQYLLKHFLGGPYEKVTMLIERQASLLYFSFTASPKAELFWKEKDHFDSSAFYDTQLIFKRAVDGSVHSAIFLWLDGKEMSALKL